MSESCRWSSPTPVLTCNYRYKLLMYILWAYSLFCLTFCTTYLDFGARQLAPKSLPKLHHSISNSCWLYSHLVIGGEGTTTTTTHTNVFVREFGCYIFPCNKRDLYEGSRLLNLCCQMITECVSTLSSRRVIYRAILVAWRQRFTSLLGVMVLSAWSLEPWQCYVQRLLPHAVVKIASLLVQFQNNIFRPVT